MTHIGHSFWYHFLACSHLLGVTLVCRARPGGYIFDIKGYRFGMAAERGLPAIQPCSAAVCYQVVSFWYHLAPFP